MKKHCRKVKRILGFAELSDLPELVRSHLDGCADCRRTYERLLSFRSILTETVDDALESIPAREVSAAIDEPSRYSDRGAPLRTLVSSFFFKAAAVVVLLGAVGLAGYRTYRGLEHRSFIRQDTTAFVDQLFSESLFGTTNNGYYQSVAQSVIGSAGLLSGVLVDLGS